MPPPDAPVTLQTIADRAGVTRALVSMALRNSSKVAAATRERLQGIAYA
jgi:LacI family fructose operon transcriptional repressor